MKIFPTIATFTRQRSEDVCQWTTFEGMAPVRVKLLPGESRHRAEESELSVGR